MSEESTITQNEPHEISLKAADCPVVWVTVYKNCAEVCRQAKVSVKAGINDIKITDFVDIHKDSIRVEGKGQATVAEVSFSAKSVQKDDASMRKEDKELFDKIKAVNDKLMDLDVDRSLQSIKDRHEILQAFGLTAARHGQGRFTKEEDKSNFSLDQEYFQGMTDLLSHVKKLSTELHDEQKHLRREEQKLKEEKTVLEHNQMKLVIEDNTFMQRTCNIVIEAEKEEDLTLNVVYVLSNASWTPLYDLRMDTEQRILKLFYYGLISQNTGEDWTNTKLYLSTANPSNGGTIPPVPVTKLSIEDHFAYINTDSSLRMAPVRNFVMQSAAPPPLPSDMPRSQRKSFSRSSFRDSSISEAADLSVPPVEVSDSMTSTVYEIVRLSTVPSDSASKKVTVGTAEFKPNLIYVSVPKAIPCVFLQAKVVNTSRFFLLPGDSNVFLDNCFITKVTLSSVAPKEEFECSLGVDPGVKVDYKPLIKVNSKSGLMSSYHHITHEQNIEVKNVHSYPVQIKVKDQLPKSQDEKIKVSLNQPHIDTKNPEKNKGVTLTKSNVIEWDFWLKEMSTTELKLRYTLEYPTKERITSTVIHIHPNPSNS